LAPTNDLPYIFLLLPLYPYNTPLQKRRKNMADEADLANEQLNSELSRAINRIRSSSITGKGPKACVECGDDIPAARRELGFQFCITCAESKERKKSLFADS
jgi:RNA polymerase-binding transcription factor DksA